MKTRRRQGEGGKSFKAWVAKTKRGGKIFDKKKIIESMGCQERGGGKNLDKKKIIESMGCQEGGGEKF